MAFNPSPLWWLAGIGQRPFSGHLMGLARGLSVPIPLASTHGRGDDARGMGTGFAPIDAAELGQDALRVLRLDQLQADREAPAAVQGGPRLRGVPAPRLGAIMPV